MSNLDLPVPSSNESEGGDEDSLEALKARLLAQREVRKATLAKHKQTTFRAISASRGTTYLDPEVLKERLREEAQKADESADDS